MDYFQQVNNEVNKAMRLIVEVEKQPRVEMGLENKIGLHCLAALKAAPSTSPHLSSHVSAWVEGVFHLLQDPQNHNLWEKVKGLAVDILEESSSY